MKKGIDTKVINENIGIPVRPLDKPFNTKEIAKWRLACDNAMMNQHPTEDIEHVEIKDECKELPGHIMTLGECENAYIETINNQTLDWDGLRKGLPKLPFYNEINDPAHIAFLGHELENK